MELKPARAGSMPYMKRDAPTQGGYREKRKASRGALFLALTPPRRTGSNALFSRPRPC